ncbi:TasA family protein [Brevibacillus sp. H7]|uniref:TasA family protein n=1 Tax=Brevibacillus sp. H7 TaxID=3349138 RepID=UPI00381DE59B
MNLKKQFAMTLASVGLGAALIGGGTFAYFNDTAQIENTMAMGTLDLSVNPSTVFNLSNMKPGDWVNGSYTIANTGELDIAKVLLSTSYNVTDNGLPNGSEDIGEHIFVNCKVNTDHGEVIVFNKSLAELAELTEDNRPDLIDWDGEGHLPVEDIDDIVFNIEFRDNGDNQNVFQGDEVALTWTFEATQTDGEDLTD